MKEGVLASSLSPESPPMYEQQPIYGLCLLRVVFLPGPQTKQRFYSSPCRLWSITPS